MRYGFTLLEVLIATAIASILTVTLFFSYNQLNDSMRKVSDIADIYDTAILVEQLLFKDISGAFIPVQAIPTKEAKKKPESDKKPAEKPAEKPGEKEKKPAEKKEPEATKGETKSKVPLLKDPFIGTFKGDRMIMLSCITANPMRVYWGEKTGEPKPNCIRVVYTLQEKKDKTKKEPFYELYRQDGVKLDLGLYTKTETEVERYLIADNIVSCKVTYFVIDEKQEEEGAEGKEEPAAKKPEQAKKEAKPPIELKEFKDWIIGKDEKDPRTRLKLPTEVVMELTLANATDTLSAIIHL